MGALPKNHTASRKMSDPNRSLEIYLGRIGGDEWWYAETYTGEERGVVRGQGETRAAALIDLAAIISSITTED